MKIDPRKFWAWTSLVWVLTFVLYPTGAIGAAFFRWLWPNSPTVADTWRAVRRRKIVRR